MFEKFSIWTFILHTYVSMPVIETIDKNNKSIVDVMARINVFQLDINKGWIEYHMSTTMCHAFIKGK
jgi:hypothetical protein